MGFGKLIKCSKMIRKRFLMRSRVYGLDNTMSTLHALSQSQPVRCSPKNVKHLQCRRIASGPQSVTQSVKPDLTTASAASPSLHDFLSTGARLTTAAQAVWCQVLQPGDTAVDATCGNGHDTLLLAQAVGCNGHVYGFDIQEAAITSTRERLETNLAPGCHPCISLHQTCHSRLKELCGLRVARVVAFNLGYLPGAVDRSVITATRSTVEAVKAALEVVMPGGIISIMAYIGHLGGHEEYEEVRRLVSELSPSYWVSSETRLLNRPTAPILIMLWRRNDDPPSRCQK